MRWVLSSYLTWMVQLDLWTVNLAKAKGKAKAEALFP